MRSKLILLFILFPLSTFATTQNGIGLELGLGYPQVQLSDDGQRALYSGVGVQGTALFPLLDYGSFSTDLEVSYTYYSLENNNESALVKEWSHYSAFGSGLRFNLSYLFVGLNYAFANSKHLQSGSSGVNIEYEFNPFVWHAGLALPLSPLTALVIGYSGNFQGDISVDGSDLKFNDQTVWVRFQIDFGVSFLNLLTPGQSFEKTRDSFFPQGNF